MGELPRLVPYDDIKRGKLFNVAVPFTNGRPLSFVMEDPINKNVFRIVKKDDGFEPVTDPRTGKKKAPVLKIVTEYKLRPAIVIQDDEWNHKSEYHSVIVLPISSIYEEDKKDPITQRMIEKNDLDGVHFLGNTTGREAYVTINDPKRLHKNLLFKTRNEIIFPDKVMEDIMIKFAKCFSIKKIVQCKECEKNCETCALKLAVNK